MKAFIGGGDRLTSDRRMFTMMQEGFQYHTLAEEVAEIADRARVKKLVLTHLVPTVPAQAAVERLFKRGMSKIYSGPIIVGRDGMEIKA